MVRGQGRAGYRTAADRHLHHRVMPQPVEVDGILVAASEPRAITISNTSCRMRHRIGKSSAHPELALRLLLQQQAASECRRQNPPEFLALYRWQVEGKVGHDGCGARLIRDAIRLDTDLLRESLALRHSRP
jgi:hypothetical protein